MARHKTPTSSPSGDMVTGKAAIRASKKGDGHWVTVEGHKHVWIRGKGKGVEHAASHRTAAIEGKQEGFRAKVAARKAAAGNPAPKAGPKPSVREQAAAHRAGKGSPAERTHRATARRAERSARKADAPSGPSLREKIEAHKADPSRPTQAQSRKRAADDIERHVARSVGGQWMSDNEPSDVSVPKPGGGSHKIEVKSKTFGNKSDLSVHPGALMDKVNDAEKNPKNTWHTVLIDRRHSSEGGAHAASYSGHEIYYKRAAGRYTVGTMYKVKDMAELKRLIRMPDHKLPDAARGEFPKGAALDKLRVQAAEDRAKNNARSRARKEKLGAAAYGRG